jgi:hypothetical protein
VQAQSGDPDVAVAIDVDAVGEKQAGAERLLDLAGIEKR